MLKYVLDGVTLLLGVYIAIQIVRSAIAGTIGTAFKLILAGIFILAINHLLDTAYLADMLKATGHTTDFLQASIVHRTINLVGFVVMTAGFRKLSKTSIS